MKTGLKLGIVALSLVAMATTIYTQTVKADADATAEVKVTIVAGENTCDAMSGYVWGDITASISSTDLTGITNSLRCVLLKDEAANVTFSLTNLGASTVSQNIANSQFTIAANTGTVNGSLETYPEYPATVYSQGGTFYAKGEHKVGEFTKEITISGVVPAGTPVATYTGELNIVISDVTP